MRKPRDKPSWPVKASYQRPWQTSSLFVGAERWLQLSGVELRWL